MSKGKIHKGRSMRQTSIKSTVRRRNKEKLTDTTKERIVKDMNI